MMQNTGGHVRNKNKGKTWVILYILLPGIQTTRYNHTEMRKPRTTYGSMQQINILKTIYPDPSRGL